MIRSALAVCLALPAGAGEISQIDHFPYDREPVVVLGEVHDNPAHHANQAQAVARVKPSALVFEMLSREQGDAANASDRTLAALEAATGWAESGWPDFSMYFPIFGAAPEAAIYGAAPSRAQIMDAMKEGAESVFDGHLPTLSAAERSARERIQAEAHCDALPADMLPGMVEAQRFRDASFAAAALQALGETGGPVVVITGNGHARTDWGVPAHLRAAEPDLRVIALGQLEAAPVDPPPFDVWIVTDAAVRPDPCAGFR